MATIFINDLRVDTIIGICEWELDIEQPLYFDIEMGVDIRRAAETDSIDKALDYAAVAEQVTLYVKAHSAKLLEAMLTDLMRHLFVEFSVLNALSLTVRKPQAIKNAACAGLSLSASRGALR